MFRKSLIAGLSMLMVSIGAPLSLTGCADDNKNVAPPPKAAPMPTGRAALIGQWASGRRRLSFFANGNFTWNMIRPCGAPPCKLVQLTGTFAVAGNQISLTLANGKSFNVGYRHSGPPRQLFIDNRMYNSKVTFQRVK